ncbi:MAG TPA: DNA polymerase, partial [Thermodesulfobacteriota bacterium]|nr:DNA polymerase [Thermodesulfobacteriota bacterium]
QIFLERFFEAYKGIARWHKQVRESGTKESRTILGRRRLWDGEPKITELLNSPVQGTAADIAKRALSMLPDALEGTGAKLIGCVHDELILETPETMAESMRQILEATMTKAGQNLLQKVPVEAEVIIADHWKKA